MLAKLTSIFKSEYDGRYKIELKVNKFRFFSVALFTKDEIIKDFNISSAEFDNFLNE